MEGVLVIVPCGKAKVWDRHPERQAVPAQDAYTGAPFTVNTAYARHFADEWRVLSAKYGFLAPDEPITRYNVTFKDPHAPDRITIAALHQQIREQGLDRFPLVVGLGGSDYRAVIAEAFALTPARLVFPFARLPIGRAMAAAKQAIADESQHERWLREDSRTTVATAVAPALEQRAEPPVTTSARATRTTDEVPTAYQPLAAYLAGQSSNYVTCSFAQIEEILGHALPRSARTHAAWWANSRQGHTHAATWLATGWTTARVDLTHDFVTFLRQPPS